MPDRSDPFITSLIASVAARTDAQDRDLARSLADRCWPGRSTDRCEPIGLEWLRRWAPKPAPLLPPACSCAGGRCHLCN